MLPEVEISHSGSFVSFRNIGKDHLFTAADQIQIITGCRKQERSAETPDILLREHRGERFSREDVAGHLWKTASCN